MSSESKRVEAAFCGEMLAAIRREFFKGKSERQFYQERPWLLRAITYPAAYLHKRGALLPAARYRAILTTVIDTIKGKGNREKIERFSVYFLHCVQTHMAHHGEEYYYAGKRIVDGRASFITSRPVKEFVGGAMKKIAAGTGGDQTVPILAAAHAALTFRARSRRATAADSELELPGLCNAVAKRPQ